MDDLTYKLLSVFYDRPCLNMMQLGALLNEEPLLLGEEISYLQSHDYIRSEDSKVSTPDTMFKITYVGKAAFLSEKKSRRHFAYNEIRAWITLLIAVVALILSIVGFN